MEDRFKFRLYDKSICEMVYDVCVGFIKAGLKEDWVCADTTCGQITYTGDKLKDIILMQSTGLKDKNGKLIYEGDILQENWHKYILEWANGAYVIKDIKRGTSYMFTSGMCIHKSEVIGNIYENKELLNE